MANKNKEEKFSNHPCHRLSVPAAKRFWCRHCFEMFDDAISRWRHSKSCKNTSLSNMTRRREQEASALEAYCESTTGKKMDSDGRNVVLPNLNPKTTNKAYAGPKENSWVDLSCFICKKQFTTMEKMKDHVRVPCNKVIPVTSDDVFPFATRSTPKPSTPDPDIIFHGNNSRQGAAPAETVYELEDDSSVANKRTPSPLDPSNLSSETMAAVEALNMMARSDKVNLTQFLNQLSEGGFVIEQAAGTSSSSDSQDREIVFTVQGDVGEGNLLQQGGDITVEVAEDLIRMAQRVRVEAVERVVEEQVQEEVVQEDLVQQTEVQYIQDHTQYIQEQAQYIEQAQFVEQQNQYVQEQAAPEQMQFVQEEPQFVQEQPQYTPEAAEGLQESTYTIVNMETGKQCSEAEQVIVSEAQLSNVKIETLTSDSAQILVVPVDQTVVTKQESNSNASIPGSKRKLDEDNSMAEGEVQVKLENGSQVKKLCTEVVTEQNVQDCNLNEEAFEAKKKLRFYSEGLIVQEKCNKNSEPSEKCTLETDLKLPCDNVENLSELPHQETTEAPTHLSDTHIDTTFLDEIDGFFKPMTEDMMKVEEPTVDISALMTVESTSPESKSPAKTSPEKEMTAIKKIPCRKKPPPTSPKKLRSSSRKLVLTPKKQRLVEEKEKVTKKKKINESDLNVKTQPQKAKPKPVESSPKKELVPAPEEKPKKVHPPKPLKCRACEKVFNSVKTLQKHKSVPCVVKITRNLCQKILRPKRALPRPPEKKVVKRKPVNKDSKKPKLLPVGFRIQAQWIPCKRDRKSSKGRGRPRKQNIHYERKKRIILPDRTIEVSSLCEKEQFFFELGLVCSDYILEEFRRPLPQVEITTSLSVSVENDICDKSSLSDISPPLLEKMEPVDVGELESSQPPDLTCEEDEELEPPLLEPVHLDQGGELREPKEDQDPCDVSLVPASEDSAVKSGRHFLDSFTSDHSSDVDEVASKSVPDRHFSDVVPPLEDQGMVQSSNQPDMIHQLKSTLKTVCSPQKVRSATSSPTLKMPDVTSDISPQSKRNLFETLQTMCSSSPKKDCTSPYANSPKLSVSALCTSAGASMTVSSSTKSSLSSLSPKKCLSTNSSPKKTPNILARKASSELGAKERGSSILDIVAESMGLNVSGSNSPVRDTPSTSIVSPGRESPRCKSAGQRHMATETYLPVQNCKKNLFESCESLLPSNTHDRSRSLNSTCKTNLLQPELTGHKDNSQVGKSKTLDQILPTVSLTPSKSGQIIVSPIQRERRSAVKCSAASVKRKLCDAATQCEGMTSSSPVKTMLGQLEQRLKLLKSALRNQNGVQQDTEESLKTVLKDKKDLLPQLVSVLLKHGSSDIDKSQIGLPCKENGKHMDNNLPDVVKSVTESRDLDVSRVSGDDSQTGSPSCHEKSVSSVSTSCNTDKQELDVDQKKNSPEEASTDSSKVTVQYINQLEPSMANGVTYLLIQQEGMEDYLKTCLSSDLDLESGETIHAVSVDEEEVLTDSLSNSLFGNSSVSRTVDHEVFVNSSGF
ncbi:titin-like [Haliotis cracherodii]|uniref:titin-like n=1 Tax=Haliotis cracherodii TaxID=6455 RepID=UPI0039E95F79